jgi:hypothetical protein
MTKHVRKRDNRQQEINYLLDGLECGIGQYNESMRPLL